MSALTVKNLSKDFGDFRAVASVSLRVEPDEVLCLLGPSGCGKTTTLRMIAGLESASEGEICFGGDEVTARPPQARNVAMAFQFYALYPDLTVGQNLLFPLDSEPLSRAEKDRQLHRIAEVLQLVEVLDRYPHQLSEGEKQRVAVGRCIIRQPNAFLFDEPLSRLDVALREEMRGSIRRILADLDRPTVIVTHDQLEAMTMGDRIAVMRDGRIEQAGTPADVFDYPVNTFVAGFIGTPQMTLLDGTCTALSGDRVVLSFGSATVNLDPGRLVRTPRQGAPVTLGFRPRAARLGTAGLSFGGADLMFSEHMGAETLLHLEWQDQAVRVLTQDTLPTEDKGLSISVPPEDCHLFDADGLRIKTVGEVN